MKYYVYQFLNKKNEVIYIGKTQYLRKRLTQQHFTVNGHLETIVYLETEKVLAAELISHEEMDIYERYLINIETPKYNKMMNNANSFRFELPKLDWKEVRFDKEKLIKRILEKQLAKVEEELFREKHFNENQRKMANIEMPHEEFDERGYIVINHENTILLNLEMPRISGHNRYVGGTEKERIEKNPFCRYIIVDNLLYFCISDIEAIIRSRLEVYTTTRAMIKKGMIKPHDVLILSDSTLKERFHVGSGQNLRFGNERWLARRIALQVQLNRRFDRNAKDTYGWTPELRYFAEDVLIKEEKRRVSEGMPQVNFFPTKEKDIAC